MSKKKKIENKNLLYNTSESDYVKGLFFINNEDGSVTITGTATGDIYYKITRSFKSGGVDLAPGKYIVSMGKNIKKYEGISLVCNVGTSVKNFTSYGVGQVGEYEINVRKNDKVSVHIRVRKGRRFNHYQIYPMIRNASIKDGTYEKCNLVADEDIFYIEEENLVEVNDVSMMFKISQDDSIGLKEYLIKLVQDKVKKKKFYALSDISFTAKKGQVLGIIGTNGSGKSTLLKIVSGALKPTSGRVYVGTDDVQILTLGTGFDGELTARENVYLNGALIGYSKEFIDTHYDDIVRFAELEGFMNEKIKNFSSGMRSRLGFAIATASDTAELLILDKVLSVGDEFFRKKSLARVKELIHGGSTVILVSHGMATIRDNCDKVIWIENGTKVMEGKPSLVCNAYQKGYIDYEVVE